MGIPDIKMKNAPAPGEEYVMECTLIIEHSSNNGKADAKRKATFEGYATKAVVEQFLAISATIAGCAPYTMVLDEVVE